MIEGIVIIVAIVSAAGGCFAGLQARRADRAEKAINAFLKKWESVEPAISNAFILNNTRGMPYSGPTLEDELAEFNRIVKGR